MLKTSDLVEERTLRGEEPLGGGLVLTVVGTPRGQWTAYIRRGSLVVSSPCTFHRTPAGARAEALDGLRELRDALDCVPALAPGCGGESMLPLDPEPEVQ